MTYVQYLICVIPSKLYLVCQYLVFLLDEPIQGILRLSVS